MVSSSTWRQERTGKDNIIVTIIGVKMEEKTSGHKILWFDEKLKKYFCEEPNIVCEGCQNPINNHMVFIQGWNQHTHTTHCLCLNCSKHYKNHDKVMQIFFVILSPPTKNARPLIPISPQLVHSGAEWFFVWDNTKKPLKCVDRTKHKPFGLEGARIGLSVEEVDANIRSDELLSVEQCCNYLEELKGGK